MYFLSATLFAFCFLNGLCYADSDIGRSVLNYGKAFDLKGLKRIKNEGLAGRQENKRIYTIFIKHLSPDIFRRMLSELFPDLVAAVDNRSRSITFNADKLTYKRIREVAENLDKALSQIRIEVKIIEINYQNFDQYKNLFANITSGVKINYDFNTRKINPVNELEGSLVYLVKNGYANILAKPAVSTVDSNKAVIKIGDRVPYITTILSEYSHSNQVHHVDTGIDLEILPKIVSGNLILAEINARVSTIKLWQTLGEMQYPVLSSRQAQTSVYIKNGETLVIAGLMDEQMKRNVTAVPFFSDLPFIGRLFTGENQEKTKTDILFLITPHIFHSG
ncbi:MAG: type II and III secretion system protein [bacterium]|nr:type II and III secretion system protein [bacterium]